MLCFASCNHYIFFRPLHMINLTDIGLYEEDDVEENVFKTKE